MAEFKFRCPACRRRLRIEVDLAGSQIRCPACQQVITVPGPEPELASDRATWSGSTPNSRTQDQTLIYWRRRQPPTSMP